MKKHFEKITIVPLVLFLTSCSYTYKDEISPAAIWTQIKFGFVKSLNSMAAGFRNLFIGISGNAFNIIMHYMEAFGPVVTAVIGTVSLLAAAAIVVRFAMSIFKNNMSDTNKEMAPDILTMIKKSIVAVALVCAVPYLYTTSFVASSYLGMVASNNIIKNDEQPWTIYDEMDEQGITYLTYCGPEAKAEGLFKTTDNLKSEQGAWDIIYPDKAPAGGYGKWCDGSGVNVYEAKFAPGKEYAGVMTFEIEGFSFLQIICSILITLCYLLAWGVGLFSIAKRICELVIQIATSWWYISCSLTDHDNESIGALGRKLLTLCLTQFFFMLEMAIFASIMTASSDILILVLGIAMIMIMISTPTAIAELVQDNGTSGQAMSLAKGRIRRHFGK